MSTERECFEAADRFLKPVLRKENLKQIGGQSLIEVLSSTIERLDSENHQRVDIVIEKALSLLEDIDEAKSNRKLEVEGSLDATQKRLVDALLDLILLEGIYPHLSPGVGVPIEQRVKSILRNGFVASPQRDVPRNSGSLASTVRRLSRLATDGSKPMSSEVLNRDLVDLVAASVQLSFAPKEQATDGQSSEDDFNTFLSRISTVRLLPCLTALLHPTAPSWLKLRLAIERSLLPMRPDGVLRTIDFMSRSIPANSSAELANHNRSGLSQNALLQVSKLLSSVPSTIPAEQYFAAVGPQLLDLLDHTDENTNQAASYIIGHGILNRRETGTPGTPGWEFLVEPLLKAIKPINPSQDAFVQKNFDTPQSLAQPLRRLSKILSSPNPGLLRRLVTPILLPLWAITNEAKRATETQKLCSALLQQFFRVTAGATDLLKIVDNLCWDGHEGWKYHLDSRGNVSIVPSSDQIHSSDHLKIMLDVIPSRVQCFIQLLRESAEDNLIVVVFLHVLRRWLLDSAPSNSIGNSDSRTDILLQKYIDAQIAQGLIMQQKSWLIAEPLQIIDLCNELFDNFIASHNVRQAGRQPKNPSLSSIASIVQNDSITQFPSEAEKDSEETVSVSLALLTHLFNDSKSETALASKAAIERLRATIFAISQLPGLSSNLRSSAKVLVSKTELDVGNRSNAALEISKSSDRNIYQKAMEDIAAAEPHVRAQAILLITTLIRARSEVISAAPLGITLLSLVQDQESFVYLPAIQALASLARLDPTPVMKQLVDAYEDRLETSSIDIQLRVGEALQSVIEDIGHQLPQTILQKTNQTLLRMAGRRTIRPKASKAQKAKQASRDQRRKDVGLTPDEASVELSDSDSDAEDLRTQVRAAAILEGWQGKAGEEDVRIRASSLALLSTIIENCSMSAISYVVSQTVEVLHGILKNESVENKIILRRAAVLGFMSIFKASDITDAGGIMPGFENGGRSLDDIVELLETLKVHDEDDVVRGHAEKVLESLETWRENRLQRMIAGEDIRFGLEEKGTLKGIDVNIDKLQQGSQSKPKIEEVE